MAIVREHGPELIRPRSAVNVVPNAAIRGAIAGGRKAGNVYHMPITVNVPTNTFRATADQIAIETAVAIQRAMRKIG